MNGAGSGPETRRISSRSALVRFACIAVFLPKKSAAARAAAGAVSSCRSVSDLWGCVRVRRGVCLPAAMPHTADLLLDNRLLLGEGPVWHARTGRLFWVDIKGRAVHSLDPATNRAASVAVPEDVGTVVPTHGTKLLVALRRRLALLDFATGRLATFPAVPLEPEGNRFNDGKCDAAGRFWVGSMDDAEKEVRGRLYRMDADLHVRPQLDGVFISNGLAWSADARTMYYIDSPTQRVDAFDFDQAAGTLSNRRTLRQFAPGDGFPDGQTIDAEGFLWVGMWDGWAVHRLDPRTGATVDTIKLPVARVTSCAFGGPQLDTLYITTARIGLTAEQQAAQPHAGSLFTAKPGVRGIAAAEFVGA